MSYSLADDGILLTKIVLLLYSLAGLAIAIGRWLAIRDAAAQEQAASKAVRAAFSANSPGASTVALDQAARFDCPSCAALRAAHDISARLPLHASDAAEQAFAASASNLRRGLRTIASIASTAPYVGLFGTVLGILAAFHSIAVTGQTGAAIVAGGVTDALVTTAMGLAVAVPAVLIYNALSGMANDVILAAERHAREMVASLLSLGEEKPTP